MIARTCLGCSGLGWVRDMSNTLATGGIGTCAACLSTGQVTDRITVQDALADAETYQYNVARIIGREPFNRPESVRFARAAFRAIPGLRG